MRTCFVPFCDVKNKDQPNRTMFLVPKDQSLFAQWAKALPKVRSLRLTDRVCYLHFRTEDVVYTFDHYINGRIYKIERDRPRLKPDALPRLEMTTKEELLSYRVKLRLPGDRQVNSIMSDNTLSEQIIDLITEEEEPELEFKANNISDEIRQEEQVEQVENCAIIVNLEHDVSEFNQHQQTTNDQSENQVIEIFLEESNLECYKDSSTTNGTNSDNLALMKTSLFNSLYANAYDVLTPNTLWGLHRSPDRSLICFSYMDLALMQVTKMICIKTDGTVQLFCNGSIISTLQLSHDIKDVDSLSQLLTKVDMWHLCFGKTTNPTCEIVVEPNDDNCYWTDDDVQVFLCKLCITISQREVG